MTSLNQNSQTLRKVSSQFFVNVMWSKFHQNRPRIMEMKGRDIHTHAHIHTYKHILTHRRGSPLLNLFSPEMTEY